MRVLRSLADASRGTREGPPLLAGRSNLKCCTYSESGMVVSVVAYH